MTMREYYLRLEAYKLKQAEQLNNLAMQAWFNQTVKATKGSSKHPKPKYEKIDDFFDYQKAIDDVRSEFESDYEAKSTKSEKIAASQIFAMRQKEFEKLWDEGRIKHG